MKTMPPEQAAAIRDKFRPDIDVGSRIKFDGDHRWWDVRCLTEDHVVLTRQQAFEPKGVLCYTVIDWAQGFRGPADLIGGGWGDGTYSDEACAALLDAMTLGRGQRLDGGVEVSWRNRVPVVITALKLLRPVGAGT